LVVKLVRIFVDNVIVDFSAMRFYDVALLWTIVHERVVSPINLVLKWLFVLQGRVLLLDKSANGTLMFRVCVIVVLAHCLIEWIFRLIFGVSYISFLSFRLELFVQFIKLILKKISLIFEVFISHGYFLRESDCKRTMFKLNFPGCSYLTKGIFRVLVIVFLLFWSHFFINFLWTLCFHNIGWEFLTCLNNIRFISKLWTLFNFFNFI